MKILLFYRHFNQLSYAAMRIKTVLRASKEYVCWVTGRGPLRRLRSSWRLAGDTWRSWRSWPGTPHRWTGSSGRRSPLHTSRRLKVTERLWASIMLQSMWSVERRGQGWLGLDSASRGGSHWGGATHNQGKTSAIPVGRYDHVYSTVRM